MATLGGTANAVSREALRVRVPPLPLGEASRRSATVPSWNGGTSEQDFAGSFPALSAFKRLEDQSDR